MNFDDLRIVTPRLILRPPHRDDLDAWATMMLDEPAARFIGGVMPRATSWRALMTMIGAWHAHGFAMFSVIEKDSGRWIGRLGPWRPEGWPGPEIGWALAREFWGRGYATEGARAATDWAFDHLGWDRVIHSIHPDNVASQAVARRLGSRNLGPGMLPAPYEGSPTDIWGQSREDWRARSDQDARGASQLNVPKHPSNG
jgi:RimJ/RimL family protein N-acetyltransferase